MSDADRARVLFVHGTSEPDAPLTARVTSLGFLVTARRFDEATALDEHAFDVALVHVHANAPEDLSDLAAWTDRPEGLEVIAALADADPEVGSAALAAGASCWVSCEVEPETLQQLIGGASRRHRSRTGDRTEFDRYRMLVDDAPIGVFEIENGVLTDVNEYLERMSGYTRSEITALPPAQLVVPEDRERLLVALEERSSGKAAEDPSVYRFVGKTGEIFVGEVRSRIVPSSDGGKIEGTIRNITHEIRRKRLLEAVLELGEIILGEQDINRILQLVLDTITEYSGFRRAVLSLYDLSIPTPFEGDVYKTLTSGLTPEEEVALLAQDPLPPDQRSRAFTEEYRLGPAYYIPHNNTPWPSDWGITGTLSVEGWHKDDFLFIPLRGAGGIIGSISVDDPIDQSVPTITSIEPVASLASFAALAVERVYRLNQLQRQKDRLHGLAGFGSALSGINDVEALCELAARRVRDDMDYDYCAIWIVEGEEIVKLGLATKPLFSPEQITVKGMRSPIEGGGITRHALRYQEPVIVADVRADSRYQGARSSIRSFIAIPVPGHKGPLGVIAVESRTLAAFGDEDVEVLTALASQLSIAVSALKQRDALERIYAFGQRVATASTLDQVVSSTLDFLVEQFDYEHSELFLNNAQGVLAIEDVRGPYNHSGIVRGWTLPSGKGIVGWVARNKRGALVEDVDNDPRYYKAFGESHSELAVPVLASDNLLGVLNVESRFHGFFDAEDRQLLGVIANHLAIALSNLESQESLRDQAVRDPLTGLYNRHYFNSIIAPELDRSDRYDHSLTLMMVDVDGFRAINNRFGHLKGDEVLKEVALFLGENVRAADRVIRYGGDEFLVFMPETDEEAPQVAHRLRKRMPAVPRRIGIHGVEIGLSIGIYTRRPRETRTLESILEEVDRRMYADKRQKHADRADEYHC